MRKTAEEQTAVIMQAMCCRQKPRRMNHQPNEMKTVLVPLSVAFTAGRSEIVMNRELNPKWSFGTRSIRDWTNKQERRLRTPNRCPVTQTT